MVTSRPPSTPDPLAAMLAEPRFELIPMAGVQSAIDALPPRSRVSVTASPRRGLDATLELVEVVASRGHRPTPHIAARMVRSKHHLAELVERAVRSGVDDLFVIAGDFPDVAGPYDAALDLLADLVTIDIDLRSVGVASYPDGHPLNGAAALREALHAKCDVLASAGWAPYATTQMCFDDAKILAWLSDERAHGLDIPVVLGVPGAVERHRLLSMGARLGVGPSIRYLRKHRAAIGRLVRPQGYDPLELLDSLDHRAVDLGIEAVHLFTFNQVGPTVEWLEAARNRDIT